MAAGTDHLSSFELTLFAQRVEEKTGVPWLVVVAWVYLENGPKDNPLNISPGGKVAHYGTLEGAIRHTIALLNTPTYAPIRTAAKTGNDRAVLDALARSPWATDPQYRTKLAGTYARARADWAGGSDGVLGFRSGADVAGEVAGDVKDAVLAPVERAVHSAEEWIQREAKVALAYVGLTGLALMLFVTGLELATGAVSGTARNAARSRELAGEIPF